MLSFFYLFNVSQFPFQGNSHCVDSDARGMLCMIWLEVKSIQGVMGRQSGWRQEPGSYKACPNKAVTSFLCLHKRSVWNCPCLIWCCLSVFNYKAEMPSKQQQVFRMCVHPCPRYVTGWGCTRYLCCLFGRGACTGQRTKALAMSTAMCFPCGLSDPAWRSFIMRVLRLAFPRALVPRLPRHSEGCSPVVRKWICQRD